MDLPYTPRVGATLAVARRRRRMCHFPLILSGDRKGRPYGRASILYHNDPLDAIAFFPTLYRRERGNAR